MNGLTAGTKYQGVEVEGPQIGAQLAEEKTCNKLGAVAAAASPAHSQAIAFSGSAAAFHLFPLPHPPPPNITRLLPASPLPHPLHSVGAASWSLTNSG